MTQDPNMPGGTPPGDVPPPPGDVPPGGTPPPAAPIGYGGPENTYTGYNGPAPTKDDQTMAMLCHLLGIFTWFIGPLIIWLTKKDTSPFVDDQGKESMNWHLTLIIAWVIGIVTACFIVGYLILLAAFVCNVVFCIMGAMKANKGIAYRYPFSIKFIK
jgi:uncharacterized Tic20 family protein